MNITEKIKEVQGILAEISKLSEEDLQKFSEEVNGLNSGLYSIQKSFKSLAMRGKKAQVKKDSKWIYAGHTLPVLGVYMIHNGKNGVYKKGSMTLMLDLRGTEFEYRPNLSNPEKPYHQTYTVIHDKDLIIID